MGCVGKHGGTDALLLEQHLVQEVRMPSLPGSGCCRNPGKCEQGRFNCRVRVLENLGDDNPFRSVRCGKIPAETFRSARNRSMSSRIPEGEIDLLGHQSGSRPSALIDDPPATADMIGIRGMDMLDCRDIDREAGQSLSVAPDGREGRRVSNSLEGEVDIRHLREMAPVDERSPLVDPYGAYSRMTAWTIRSKSRRAASRRSARSLFLRLRVART